MKTEQIQNLALFWDCCKGPKSVISGDLLKNTHVWATQWLTSSELKIKFDPSLDRSECEFFGPWFFIIFKNWHQDLSNEGSNFILSSLEVGHWVAQTWHFFDKLPEVADFGPLQQSQNRARFWICSVFT